MPDQLAYLRFVHFRSCACPEGVEGAPEANCSLQFSKQVRVGAFAARWRVGACISWLSKSMLRKERRQGRPYYATPQRTGS